MTRPGPSGERWLGPVLYSLLRRQGRIKAKREERRSGP
jgi:hypothetical protein